jgi:predicted ribosomally synthesized peptide with nif11-like leader
VLTAAVVGARLEAQTLFRAMSEEQLAAFWEAVEADASLQETLSASTDGEIDTPIEAAAVVAIAKDAGFTITAGDLLRADAEAILELNDEELEKVAGGFSDDGDRFPTTQVLGPQVCPKYWNYGNCYWHV